jgi:hypothetical protein
MKVSTSNAVRILIVLALAITEAVYLLRFYEQPISTTAIILSLEVFFVAIPLLWSHWLRGHGIFFYTMLALGFGAAAVADWMKRETISAVAFAGVFLFGAVGILRKLFRSRTHH